MHHIEASMSGLCVQELISSPFNLDGPRPLTFRPETEDAPEPLTFKAETEATEMKVIYKGNNTIYLQGNTIIKENNYNKDYALREAFILAILNHKYIQSITDIKLMHKSTRIYQPFVEIASSGIVRIKDYTSAEKLNVMYNALTALHYIHSNDICHGDIKPGNFLINKDGNPESLRLIDFELACFTKETYPAYTANFRSPEAWDHDWSFPADIWALAHTFYVWFFGKLLLPVYDDADSEEVYVRPLDYYLAYGPNKDLPLEIEKPQINSVYLPGLESFDKKYADPVSGELLRMIAKMTRFDPEQRPTAEQLMKDPLFSSFFSADDLKVEASLDNLDEWKVKLFPKDGKVQRPKGIKSYILKLINRKLNT